MAEPVNERSSFRPPADLRPSPGRLLAHRREALGLQAAEVAAELHLTEGWIRALERDDFSPLPGDTFVRGYLKGYARVVETDPEPILKAYMGLRASVSPVEPPFTAPPAAPLAQPRTRSTQLGRMWLIRIALAVAVAFGLAAILLFWPQP